MASYQKFNSFVEALSEKVHNLGGDSLKIALTNVAPVAGNAVLADLTEIVYTNLSSRALTVGSSGQVAGTYKLVINDLNLTAAGGAVAPFRYVVIYNDSAANKELIGFYDYGSVVNMADGDQFIIDFDAVNGVIQLV